MVNLVTVEVKKTEAGERQNQTIIFFNVPWFNVF